MKTRDTTALLDEIHAHLQAMHEHCASGDLEAAAARFEDAEAATAAIESQTVASRASTLGLTAERELDEKVATRLSAALDTLQEDARSAFADASLSESEAARLAAGVRARSYLLRRVTRRAHDFAPLDELPFLFAEIEDIESHAGQDVSSLQRLALVRAEAAWIRATHLYGQSTSLTDPGASPRQAEAAFRIARALQRARAALDSVADTVAPAEATDVGALPNVSTIREMQQGLAQEAERLLNGVLDALSQADSADARNGAIRIASLMTSEMDEARMNAIDPTSTESALPLPPMVDDAMRLNAGLALAARRLASIAELDPKPLKRPRRRLARMTRRLRDVHSDQTLRARLERIFRPKMVRIWEAVVFWLVIAVLGLLVVEHYFPPETDGTMSWTLWLDTGICCILLLDFTARWLLSPRRGRHFARHFLTEFLPALPFGLLANLSTHPALRSIRLLRLVRVFRVLRLLQPVIRFFRLLLFVMRATDRMVERSAWLLNHDILFFDGGAPPSEDAPALVERVRDLDRWITNATDERFDRLETLDGTVAATWRARFVTASLAHCESDRPAEHDVRRAARATDVHVEEVIALLRTLDDAQVAERLGPELARQISSSLRFFRLPVLRRLPIVRFVVGPTGAPDPLWFTARLGHVFADALDKLHRSITWFTDFYGTITGSQFLDRIGLHLVKAFERPTKRLAMFAFALALVYGLVHLFRLDFLSAAVMTIVVFISGPVWMLGIICLIPLVLGLWFRRIAGQAVDFFDQVAEAQFLSLTEIDKQEWAATRIPYLAERVILPEARLLRELDDTTKERVIESARSRLCEHAGGAAPARCEEPRGEESPGQESPDEDPTDEEMFDWNRCDFVTLFFRNFVDGAWFHRNDTKIANLLLGNLTLANVRENRLRQTKAERRRVEKLDIEHGKGGILGPTPWFNFITHAIAQRTARLIIEYNQHCVPKVEVATAHVEDKRLFEEWLAMREEMSRQRAAGRIATAQGEITGAGGTLQYRTTEFHALHFLSARPERDREVARRFGTRVLALLREDRVNLIRETFGTFPIHELPKYRRVLNPYEFYMRNIARGRVLLAPFFVARAAFRVAWFALRRIIAIVKDVLDPESRPASVGAARADFDVAQRKLYRMRRPVVFESVRLRAAFDVEYLGIEKDGLVTPVPPGQRVADDLRALDAAEHEWEEFRHREAQRERQVDALARLLERLGYQGEALRAEIRRRNPAFAGHEEEAVRTLVLAFVCDVDRIASRLETRERFRDWVQHLATGEGKPPARRGRRRHRDVAATIEPLWHELAPDHLEDADLRAQAIDAIARAPRAELLRLEELRPKHGETALDLDREVLESLFEQAMQPTVWSEQLVAVRTVQSLGMIDLAGYQEVISRLGGFDTDAAPAAKAPAAEGAR